MSPGPRQLTVADLCIPIYLDQSMVFDMLAFVEDGLYELASVKTSTSDATSQKKSIVGSLGLESFWFVRLGMKGDHARERSAAIHEEREQQLVYTPASLFAKLRQRLREHGLIVDLAEVHDIASLTAGSLVEFQAVVEENPVVLALETPVEFDKFLYGTRQPAATSSANRKNQSGGTSNRPGTPKHILKVLEDLLASDERELVCRPTAGPAQAAVLTTRVESFNNGQVGAVLDGEYRVLGTILRVVPTPSDAINLLRRTPMAKAPQKFIDIFADWVSGLAQTGLQMPAKLKTSVPGPAIRIQPMAIFPEHAIAQARP